MKKGYEYIESLDRGMYYSKKEYSDLELFDFEAIKHKLPSPIIANGENYLECYWYALQVAFKNVHKPTEESGFVSNFVDAAFNNNIFMWDTVFITMFCNILHPHIPGIRSLDNFYVKQFDDGEIPREIIRDTGKDFPFWTNSGRHNLYSYFHNNYGHRKLMKGDGSGYDVEDFYFPKLDRKPETIPYLTLDNLNHPIMAWAELESYKHTGDFKRIKEVFLPLLKYYESLNMHLKKANGLYVTDWATMDNSPRNKYLGCGVDITCEMVLFAKNLVTMIEVIKEKFPSEDIDYYSEIEVNLESEMAATTKIINEYMWDKETKFYFDVTNNNEMTNIKTIAAYWSLLSDVADDEKVVSLVEWLNDKNTFNRIHRVPVCSADAEGYNPEGGYWRGSVWAPTNTMVIRGLEQRGYYELAKEIALNHLDNIIQIFKDTGTIWENYPPDAVNSGDADKIDFVGWSGIAPILYLIEHKIGIKGDATRNEITWTIDETISKSGCEKYWFNNNYINLLCEINDDEATITVTGQNQFDLRINIFNKTEILSSKKTIKILIKK